LRALRMELPAQLVLRPHRKPIKIFRKKFFFEKKEPKNLCESRGSPAGGRQGAHETVIVNVAAMIQGLDAC